MNKGITEPEVLFEEKIMNLYPDLFYKDSEDKPIQPACGISCPQGWKFLVENLCKSIDYHIKNKKISIQKHKTWFAIKMFIYSKFIKYVGEIIYDILNPYKRYKPKSAKNDKYWIIRPEISELVKEKHPRRLTIFQNVQMFFIWFRPSYKWHSEKVPAVTIDQIKEKFGELRFYYSGGDEVIAGMVQFAEYLSSKTCEVSGEPGELCKKSKEFNWYKTLSPKIAKKMKYISVVAENTSASEL